MRPILYVVFLFLIQLPLTAQNPGELYRFHLAFEDAVGNRDTIWFVRDSLAGSVYIDTLLGEVPDSSVFNLNFEVRWLLENQYIGWGSYLNGSGLYRTNKTVVVDKTGDAPYNLYQIFVRLNHPPLKMTWDTGLFYNEPRLMGFHLTSNSFIHVWELLDFTLCHPLGVCLSEGQGSHVFFDLGVDSLKSQFLTYRFEKHPPITNGEFDSLYVINLVSWYPNCYTPPHCICSTPTPAWVYTPSADAVPQVTANVVPNPVSTNFSVKGLESYFGAATVEIYDFAGRSVWRDRLRDTNDVSALFTGLYTVLVRDLTGKPLHRQLVVKAE